ncbi:MAG: gamma carbonic anhydrase family protein [Leptospirales bacterium]|nr:gamma carbonic anhydrase family protein [Leptospirales bacterium]
MKSKKKSASPGKKVPQKGRALVSGALAKRRAKAPEPHCYVHPDATVMGDVIIGKDSSIWPGAVLRGDMNQITIGSMVNIQDNCTLHVDNKAGLSIGDYTLVGHNCMIHSCTIGRACLIGIGSIILEGAVIGDGAMITAGCLIRGGKKIPPFALVVSNGGELTVYENKAKTVLTIAGSIEYLELAKRAVKEVYGPFSKEDEERFLTQAKRIHSELFSSRSV